MRFRFIISQTFKGLVGNKAMTASVMLVTFVSLLFVGAGALLQTQISNLKDEWYDKVEVSAFMCPRNGVTEACAAGEATQEQIDDIDAYLKTPEMQAYVENVMFETKEQALQNYREQMRDTAWTEDITADQMQVSFRIKLKDPQQYQVVADQLSGRPGVEVVRDQREQLEPIFAVMNRFTVVAGLLAGVMILTALLLIPTTIRLSAMSRATETGIMRLVGASNFFIELPFVLEGAIAALMGSLLSVGGLFLVAKFFLEDWIGAALPWMKIVGTADVWILAPWLIIGAVLVAGFASWLSLRRYVRV
ncbi:permease-like cell division protein FtsX [Actinobaculum suis]|uniref:permease-like cell division protein FtsX n=1 Tax=Actinobaculum suis TaxID=1657 RepID=UPI00080A0591|nr:permease-like cell division protein FtsX [Actinobaculum suis]OCA96005.1 cell division protein FtsX [Actinobaculum suis]